MNKSVCWVEEFDPRDVAVARWVLQLGFSCHDNSEAEVTINVVDLALV